MNSYLCFGKSGKSYLVNASHSNDACAKVYKFNGDGVSCWFMAAMMRKFPEDCVTIN